MRLQRDCSPVFLGNSPFACAHTAAVSGMKEKVGAVPLRYLLTKICWREGPPAMPAGREKIWYEETARWLPPGNLRCRIRSLRPPDILAGKRTVYKTATPFKRRIAQGGACASGGAVIDSDHMGAGIHHSPIAPVVGGHTEGLRKIAGRLRPLKHPAAADVVFP